MDGLIEGGMVHSGIAVTELQRSSTEPNRCRTKLSSDFDIESVSRFRKLAHSESRSVAGVVVIVAQIALRFLFKF